MGACLFANCVSSHPQPCLHPPGFIFQRLGAIRPRPQLHHRENPGRAHFVNDFMTPPDGGKYRLLLTFNVRSVRMQLRIQSRLR